MKLYFIILFEQTKIHTSICIIYINLTIGVNQQKQIFYKDLL